MRHIHEVSPLGLRTWISAQPLHQQAHISGHFFFSPCNKDSSAPRKQRYILVNGLWDQVYMY